MSRRPNPTWNKPLQTIDQGRVSLGSFMRPVIPRTGASEASGFTGGWYSTSGYASERSIAYNSATSLGLIDRGAKLEAVGAWGNNFPAWAGAYSNPYFLEFWYDGTDIAIQMFPANPSTMDFRVYVDGWPMHDWQHRTYAAGMDTVYKMNFATAKPRLYRIYLGSTANFNSLKMPGTNYVYHNRDTRFRVIWIGDSYTQGGLAGASGELAVGASGIVMNVAHMTGWDIYCAGISSTGYVKDVGGAGLYFGSSGRLAQIANLPAADLIVIAGSGNDPNNGVSDASMTAAAKTMWDALASSRPTTPIVISGVQVANTIAGGASASTALKAEAAKHPQVRGYIDWNMAAPDGPWIGGTGKSGSQNGSGNADYVLQPDGVHPTRMGAEYIARRTVAELRRIKI